MLNCAISLGREGPGSCFTTTGLLSVTGVVEYMLFVLEIHLRALKNESNEKQKNSSEMTP